MSRADPGFWFGRGTGREFGGGGWKSPSGIQGQSPGGGLAAKPPDARRMLRHEAEKNTYGEKKIGTRRLTLYDNVIIIIVSSTRRFVSNHFCLKIQKSAGSRASEMVHNGSRA